MEPKIKKMWLKALRSGKYKQGTGELKNSAGEYCCLGVLLHCVHPRSQSLGEDCRLNIAHLKELKLTDEQQSYLIELNDNDRRSFARIASYIEKKL